MTCRVNGASKEEDSLCLPGRRRMSTESGGDDRNDVIIALILLPIRCVEIE